jgi:hypothetical protein
MNNLILNDIINHKIFFYVSSFTACTFHSTSGYPSSDTDAGKFVRIREDLPIGAEVFSIDVYPRSVIKLNFTMKTKINKKKK